MSMTNDPSAQSAPTPPHQTLRNRLKADLIRALKARQTTTVMTLRTLLAAIDNAEAVPISAAPPSIDGRSGDVPRKVLSEKDIQAILVQEAEECRTAVTNYQRLGQSEQAAVMQAALLLIESYGESPHEMGGDQTHI